MTDQTKGQAPYEFILYNTYAEGTIARIVLNRPGTRNAQHRPLLLELGDAFRPRRGRRHRACGHLERGGEDVLLGP